MGDYRKLRAWQQAHGLTVSIYRETLNWPAHERYGLVIQIRRSAASIGCNLAEGCGRNSNPEVSRFARIALGSANEVEYQLLLARDLGYINDEVAQRLSSEVVELRRMLTGVVHLNPRIARRPAGSG